MPSALRIQSEHFTAKTIATGIVLCLLAISSSLDAQNRKYPIGGVVTDSLSGLPLANVNISVVGTSGGGTTNEAGEFSLTLTRLPSILYFSYVGYGIASYQVEKSGEKDIRIALLPETREIGEVTIQADKIVKVIRGDTLNILDYEIDGDRMIVFASPYKHQSDLRIYLTTLQGEPLDYILVKKAGKQIKYPEKMMPETEYLVRDFTGQVNYLDKFCAHEVRHAFDKLFFGYDTRYPDFIGRVLPVKVEMMGSLIFQVANQTQNFTMFFGHGRKEGEILKYVRDRFGASRTISAGLLAMAPSTADYSKNVTVPIFRKGDELFLFDFFENNIEVFDSNLKSSRFIPIDFHNAILREGIFFTRKDIDTRNFTQKILFDEKAGKAYAFFRLHTTNRQSLREVNLETGKIDRIIEIPDFPNVSNIRVYDNAVYFLYDTKVYPYYRLLYRMVI